MDPLELQRAQHELSVSAGTTLRPIADAAWDLERARLEGRRFITIDLEALVSPAARDLDEKLQSWITSLLNSSYAERFGLMVMAIVSMAAQRASWRGPAGSSRPISTMATDDASYRRCTRVLAMVHELHKAGYQRVRILPMLSPRVITIQRGFFASRENHAGSLLPVIPPIDHPYAFHLTD